MILYNVRSYLLNVSLLYLGQGEKKIFFAGGLKIIGNSEQQFHKFSMIIYKGDTQRVVTKLIKSLTS